MRIDSINGGDSNPYTAQKEHDAKGEAEKLDINYSIMAVNNQENKATGKAKELLDKIINENPDFKISDGIELHLIESLLSGEEKIPMPDRDKLGEEGFDWHNEYSDMRINNFSYGSESSSLSVMNINNVNDVKYTSTTMIFDYDNDGYADYCDMSFGNDKSFQKYLKVYLDELDCRSELREFQKDTQNS